MKKLLIVVSLVLSAAALLFIACSSNSSSDSGSSSTTRNYLGTQSPGDVWSWTIITDGSGNGTFTARNETLGRDYSGSVSTMSNKFLKLLVSATTDTTITSLPANAYALEVPDTALIVKPAGSDSDVIVGVAQGECPTQSAGYNIVEMPQPGWNYLANAAYETADVTISGTSLDASVTSYLISGAGTGTKSVTGMTCSGGRITKAGDDMVIGIAPSGAIIRDGGPGEGGFFGMQAPAASVDLADATVAGREFRGVLFNQDSTVSDDTEPIWTRPNGTGGLTGGNYTNFEAGTENTGGSVTITFGAQDSAGIVNGTMVDHNNGSTADIVLMINKINGKYFIYGIAADPGDDKPELFIAVEQ